MNDLWKKISNFGVTDDLDFRLARRIVLANRFALLIAALTLIFMITFIVRGNSGILSFVGMLSIAGSVLFFNANRVTQLSRLIISLIPAVGVFMLNISQKFGDVAMIDILHYATPRLIITGSAILPFTMFTARERNYVIGAVVCIMALGLGYDLIHEAFDVDHQALGLKNEHYGIIFEDTIIMAIMILASAIFMFSMSHQYDQKAQSLLDDALQQTTDLKKNEEDLKKMLRELEASRQKDEHRSWIAKGVAELSAILQTADNTINIYERWLSSVVKYLQLNQGGLFIAEEESAGKITLKLVASYAYERKKFLQKTVDPGEGLLGQAYLEGRRIYLKQIPNEYVHITSGLGDAPPRILMIVPVKTNETTEAVLEFASFKALEDHHIELLEKLSEALASFISNYKINERTKKLLEQAQTMSEEMRSNEEEMRQNLEELTATQEALARKEKEYQQRIVDLESELTLFKRDADPVVVNN